MALLPEEIPVVLTVFLALGAWRMARGFILNNQLTDFSFLPADIGPVDVDLRLDAVGQPALLDVDDARRPPQAGLARATLIQRFGDRDAARNQPGDDALGCGVERPRPAARQG